MRINLSLDANLFKSFPRYKKFTISLPLAPVEDIYNHSARKKEKKMKKRIFGAMAIMMALLPGCSQSGQTASSNSANGNDSGTTTNSSTDASEQTGEKKEVNVYMPSPAGLQKNLEKDFEEKYSNIDMKVTSGTTGELLARIEAEKANPVCDVLILASWSDGISSLTSLDLMAYTPVGAENIYDEFKHSSNKIWGTSASAVGVLYNTDLVSKEKIEKLDWSDFADKDKVNAVTNSGEAKMSMPDPTKSGACKDFLAGYVSSKGETAAWNDFNGWIDNGLANGGANKTALASVENGDVDILVAGVDYNAYSDKAKGTKVDIYYPKGGTVVNARPAMILSSTKHEEEAKKVMDYLCSDSAQEYVAKAYLLPGSKKVDANSARTSMNDISQLSNLNWDDMAKNGTSIATTFVKTIASKN